MHLPYATMMAKGMPVSMAPGIGEHEGHSLAP